MLVSCNARPELSSAELKTYDLLISANEQLIKSKKLFSEAREFAINGIGASEQSMPSETPPEVGAIERNLSCLKEQRDQRVPSREGVVFCGKVAPL